MADLSTAEREKARRKQRRAEAKECPVHAYQRHGKEAEELRAGVQRLIEEFHNPNAPDDDCETLRGALVALLDSVDARDSLAYLERQDPTDDGGSNA